MKKNIYLFIFLLIQNTYGQNNSPKSIESLKQIYKEATSNSIQEKLLLSIADAYLENNLDSAIFYRKKAEKLNNLKKNKTNIALELLLLKELIFTNQLDLAAKKIHIFRATLLNHCKVENLLNFCILEATYYNYTHDFKKSAQTTDLVLKKCGHLKTNTIAKIYLLHAFTLIQLSDLENAFLYTNKAMYIYEKLQCNIGLNNCYFTLCCQFINANDNEKAMLFINKVLSLDRNMKSKAQFIKEQLALATLLFRQKQYEKSIPIFDFVLKENAKLNVHQVDFIAFKQKNLANFHLKKFQLVINDCNKQLNLTDSTAKLATIYYQLTLVYNKLQNYKKAKTFLNALESTHKKDKSVLLKDELEFLEIAIATEKGLRNSQKALLLAEQYIEKYKIYTKQLYSDGIIKNQVAYDAKKNEIEVLSLQNATQKQYTAKNEKATLIGLVFFFTFLMLLFIHLSKKIHKKNKILKNQYAIIELSRTEIERSNQSIRKTFSIIAHDLREPFNVLLGYTNYIIDNYDAMDQKEIVTYLKIIKKKALSNFNFTQQLLNWSLKQQLGFVVNYEKVNINNIVFKSISNLNSLATQKKITINTLLETSELNNGLFDKDIVFNVLYNLISNALKYSNEKSKIVIKSSIEKNYVKFEVIDFGIGMNATKVEELNANKNATNFDFIKSDSEYIGGFGLIYTKELMNIYGGKLVFKSIVNEGTTVYAFFPLRR